MAIHIIIGILTFKFTRLIVFLYDWAHCQGGEIMHINCSDYTTTVLSCELPPQVALRPVQDFETTGLRFFHN